MTLKILTPAEIKQAKESELTRDTLRIATTRDALSKVQKELNDVEAKFEVALANQHVRWANEEKEAVKRLDDIRKDIEIAEKKRDILNSPIEEEKKKAHDLFIEAEKVLRDAKVKMAEAEQKLAENERTAELLSERLDDVSQKEQEALELGQKNAVRALAIEEERNQIRSLSKELSIKLSKL